MPRITRSYRNTPSVVRRTTTSRPTSTRPSHVIPTRSPQRPITRPTQIPRRPRSRPETQTLSRRPTRQQAPQQTRGRSWPSSSYTKVGDSRVKTVQGTTRTYENPTQKIKPKNSPLKPLTKVRPPQKTRTPSPKIIALGKSSLGKLGKGGKAKRKRVVKVTKGKPHGRKVVTYRKAMTGKFPTIKKRRLY